MSTSKDKGARKMKYAIKIRWLGYNHKWHRHTTKWYDNSSDAWEEADKFDRKTKSLEMSRGLAHKE